MTGESVPRHERAGRLVRQRSAYRPRRGFSPGIDAIAVVGDFAAAEFASVIARRVRTGDLSIAEAQTVFPAFDLWAAQMAEWIETTAADVRTATAFVRRLDLTLRAPDALNIALAQRARTSLATFDTKMAACATAIGAAVAVC